MSDNNFGEFGNVDRRRFTFSSVLKLLFFLSILIAIPAAFGGWKDLYLSVLEKQKPVFKIIKIPKAIGLSKQNLEFTVSDKQSGLKSLAVTLDTNGKKEHLLNKAYLKNNFEDTVKLEIKPKSYYQDKSSLSLLVKATDRSYWRNVASIDKTFEIDLSPPKIKLLSKPDKLSLGSLAMLSYQIEGETKALNTYLSVAGKKYTSYKGVNKNYFAYFTLPIDCFDCKVTIESSDYVSNRSSLAVDINLSLAKTENNVNIDLSNKFLQEYKKYSIKTFEKEIKYFDSDKLFISSILDDLETEKKAKVLYKRPSLKRYWKGKFFYPGGKKGEINFASTLNYSIDGKEVGKYVSPGVFFAGDNDIRAANSGRVIFSSDYGLLGKTIILDHGFGLYSLYSSLSEQKKREGDKVNKGEVIAKSGKTGLFNQSGCMYQIRIQGQAVNPENLWKETW